MDAPRGTRLAKCERCYVRPQAWPDERILRGDNRKQKNEGKQNPATVLRMRRICDDCIFCPGLIEKRVMSAVDYILKNQAVVK